MTALHVVEAEGLVWVWPGEPGAPGCACGPPAASVRSPAGYTIHAELVLDVPVEHGLLLENLLDLAHAPFTHTSTFAKGWPVPGEWPRASGLGWARLRAAPLGRRPAAQPEAAQ